jgi:hypothetical protein
MDNVEILRRAVDDLWNAGRLDEYMEIYAEDAELQPNASFPDLGVTISGKDAIHRFFKKINTPTTWKDFQTIGDKVIASFQWDSGDAGGSPTWTLVYTFKDGLVVRAQYFQDRLDALCAAGFAPAGA